MNRLFSYRLYAVAIVFCLSGLAMGADIQLAKDSTLEGILRRGSLRVGFEAGYLPFESQLYRL